ncbi:MAG TPA: AAA family ATPase, partial [Candidatus Nitrosotalea sp.]|nr:AAA family ATPase [Candidatus Nitrosotalea sp.]
MAQTLQRDEREAGAFAPIGRPRLTERLRALSTYPVALLIAPPGYGKSVALRQYLETVADPAILFTVRAEHVTLLGFLRGLTEALRAAIPHAITTLAGAYERNRASTRRSSDLARWMQAHLGSYRGVIA